MKGFYNIFTNFFPNINLNKHAFEKSRDGKHIYNDQGKVMKGTNYFKPDLSKFIK